MKFIIGKKQEMTQLWKNDAVIAVTKVQAEPNTVVQVKTEKQDGYRSVQVGFGIRKKKNIKKPQLGHMKGLGDFAKLREFRVEIDDIKKGDTIKTDTFEIGDTVNVTANSKGRGFQGVVKRWGFAGQIKTHGNKDQLRMPGSIGATGPAHVFKGTRMGGRMGGKRITTTNLEIIDVDHENNTLYVKGVVPGARNGLVLITGEGVLKFDSVKKAEKTVEKKEIKEIKEVKKETKREEDIEEVVIEAAEKQEEKGKNVKEKEGELSQEKK